MNIGVVSKWNLIHVMEVFQEKNWAKRKSPVEQKSNIENQST